MLFPWGALEHIQINGGVVRGHRVCMSGEPRAVSLVKNTASLLGEAGSSRQLDPRDCNFQGTKGVLKFAAQKVIDLKETKLGSKGLSSRTMWTLFWTFALSGVSF